MNDKDKILIAELFEKQVDNRLSKEEADTLEKLVMENETAKDFYFDLTVQNAGLEEKANELASGNTTADVKRPIPIIYLKIAVSASLIIGLLLGVWMRSPTEKHVATLTQVDHCKWAEGTLPTAKDSKLKAGILRLEEGVAHLKFHSGVKMQIEAPVHIELINDMKCIVHKGTVMADVPEQAKGFTVNTPTANVIDHGTRFLVSYQNEKASYIEVLEGEVEVSGKDMNESQRYKTGQRVLVEDSSLKSVKNDGSYVERKQRKPKSVKSTTLFSSFGNGKEYEVIRVNKKQVHYNPQIIMIKNSECDWARKGYIRFDLSNISKEDLSKVSLNINMLETGVGFACFVDDATFDVYGLNEDSKENWTKKDMKWETAPGTVYEAGKMNSSETTLLGSFELPKGVYNKAVSIHSEKLKNFILADSNKQVTFIIVRRTAETERHGLAHGFASSKNESALPPGLVFKYK